MTTATAPKVRRLRHPLTPQRAGLEQIAARLYPDSTYLQAEWVRAVSVVRGTSRGWLLERPVAKDSGRA